MRLAGIGLIPVLLTVILISGCVGEQPKQNEKFSSCDDYCKAKGTPACPGAWNISGDYPECSCGFLCEKTYPCIDDRDCPGNWTCYYSRYCELVEGGMRCGEQLGDLLCHRDCESDNDCSGYFSSCSEKTLWEGADSKTKKICIVPLQENATENGTLVRPTQKTILPVRPGDVVFVRAGIIPYGSQNPARGGPNTGIDFEVDNGKGVFAIADGIAMSISTDPVTGGKLLTIHHSLGQGAFDAAYSGDIEPVVQGEEQVFQGQIVAMAKAPENQTTAFVHIEILDQFTHEPQCPESYFSDDAKATLVGLISNTSYRGICT